MKFKVGDKVKVIGNEQEFYGYGAEGVVIEDNCQNSIVVESDTRLSKFKEFNISHIHLKLLEPEVSEVDEELKKEIIAKYENDISHAGGLYDFKTKELLNELIRRQEILEEVVR